MPDPSAGSYASLHAPTAGHTRARRLAFLGRSEFYPELRRRVRNYLTESGKRDRDNPQMYVKSFLILAGSAVSYLMLVFVASTWWQALAFAILVGLALPAIGFNIMHDGSHGAFSRYRWVNRLAAMTLDMVGGSSYNWHQKHNVAHHTYVNITGHDSDIELGVFGRLSPHQRWLPFHRWQHYYLWPLYGFIIPKWHLFDDFSSLMRGKVGNDKIKRPRGLELVLFFAGKVMFVVLAFVIPMLRHSFWNVLLFYFVVAMVGGIVMSVVFQLAHCVVGAEFPMPSEDLGAMENAWAIHQVETTVDFARDNPVVTWLLGGLNFQVEHHLFPKICHVHYPALSRIVEATCQDYGIRYQAYGSVWEGVASHFRWLRHLSVPNA